MNNCRVCDKPDSEKPMTFRGEPYCSDLYRKVLLGELKLKVEQATNVPKGVVD